MQASGAVPCQCGNTRLGIRKLEVIAKKDRTGGWVYCKRCKAKGPIRFTAKDAVAAWNDILPAKDG